MGLALEKTIQKEEKEENDIVFYFELGQATAIDLIQFGDESITKMCAAQLYVSLLGVFDDYYNVYYGRQRKVWEKSLRNHIINIRKTCRLMLTSGLISRSQISEFVFYEDPLIDRSVTFIRLEQLICGLLSELQSFNNILSVFK